MIEVLKYGIIGAGHLGNFHVQQLKNIPNVKLVGVYDLFDKNSIKLAKQYNITQYKSLNQLLEDVDVVSITTPATTHYEVTKKALTNNCHVFVEKPFTNNIKEGEELIALQKLKKLKVQVGHIERFNPAFQYYYNNNPEPIFIESHRLCAYNERGLDVDVVLDLMIHDLDLILLLIKPPIQSIHASGTSILSSSLDMVNARIQFKQNITVNLTASRISTKQMRQMRIFESSSYSVIDFQQQSLNRWVVNKNKNLQERTVKINPTNALYEELLAFIYSIQNNSLESVTTSDALEALKVACLIQDIIEKK
jgi:predicted dehydrogenase